MRKKDDAFTLGGGAAGGDGRAKVLEAMADGIEAARERLVALCVLESGTTYADAIVELREAAKAGA